MEVLCYSISPCQGIHRISNLCRLYVDYVIKHYRTAHVVFDGYGEKPSSKDETHFRRSCSEVGADVDVTEGMLLTKEKKSFLSNSKSKRKSIHFLGSKMEQHCLTASHLSGNADYGIDMTACYNALVVVGYDTDTTLRREDIKMYTFKLVQRSSIYQSFKRRLDPNLSCGEML